MEVTGRKANEARVDHSKSPRVYQICPFRLFSAIFVAIMCHPPHAHLPKTSALGVCQSNDLPYVKQNTFTTFFFNQFLPMVRAFNYCRFQYIDLIWFW